MDLGELIRRRRSWKSYGRIKHNINILYAKNLFLIK